MPLTLDIERQLTRFKRLPQADEIWEGGIVRLPAWIDDDPDGEPRRPTAGMWISLASRAVHAKRCAGADEIETALTALCEMGLSEERAGHRPTAIRTRGREMAAAPADALAGTGTVVDIEPDLPAIDSVLAAFGAERRRPSGHARRRASRVDDDDVL